MLRSTFLGLALAAGFLWAQSGYVDAARCAGCHAKIAQTYRQTAMSRSFFRLQPEKTIEDFDKNNLFYHSASKRYYKIYRKDGKYYQRRHQIGFDGHETNVVEKEMQFVMGSGAHTRTYLQQTSAGTLLQLPVAWYSENGGYWAMNPGYDRPDHQDFRRKITVECMFCHNSYPERVAGADAAAFTGKIPEGIDCQRCHGPGQAHLRVVQNAGVTPQEARRSIINPAHLSLERQMEVCMQCHLESTAFPLPFSLRRYDRDAFSYRPGEALSDYVLHFDRPAGPDGGTFEINHAAYRLRQSACFRSSRTMTCTTCHDPHHALQGEEALQHYGKVCASCHQAALDGLVSAGRHSASPDCLGCHMPKRRTDDVVHVTMTDHYIQRRKPDRDLLAPRAEPREESMAQQGEVLPYDPPGGNELYLAVAQVKQLANLLAGIPRLEAAIEKYKPREAAFYFELAEAYRANGRPQEAAAAYREALQRRPDYVPAQRSLAMVLEKFGQLDDALRVTEELLKRKPGDAVALGNAGLIRIKLGRPLDAVKILRKAVETDPDQPEAHNSLGAALEQIGDRVEAETAFRNAIRVQPDFAQAHSNLANILVAGGDLPQAVYHYEQAIQYDPADAAARFNYGSLLVRKGDGAHAVPHLLLAAESSNPAVRQAALRLLAEISASKPIR